MDLGLHDRVALVTGGARGIGRAAALRLGQAGARVAVSYRHDRDRAEALVWELRAGGHDAFSVYLDLASRPAVEAAVAATAQRWGRIDVLVQNAVRWPARPLDDGVLFESVRPDEWGAVLRVNIDGALAALRAVVPHMKALGWGRIVNVSSAIAVDGLPGCGSYAAAKATLHGLTEELAREHGKDGILANVVMPGLTITERSAAFLPAEVCDRLAHGGPIRGLLRPDEVAATIVFLCSTQNSAITGAVIRTSGGS
jgi:3-oxoacyl-[acyl-carrier protein] reductase